MEKHMGERRILNHFIIRMLRYEIDGKPYQMTEKDFEYVEKVTWVVSIKGKLVPTVDDMCSVLPTWTREEVATMHEKMMHVRVNEESYKNVIGGFCKYEL